MADGGAVATRRVEAAADMGLARRQVGAVQPQSAGPRRGPQRRDPVDEPEAQAPQDLAGAQRPLEVTVELEVAGDPGAPEADLVRRRGDVGQRPPVADDDRVTAGRSLRAQLAVVPEAHREREAAREA